MSLNTVRLEGLQPRIFARAIKIAGEYIPLKRDVIKQVLWGAIYDWQRENKKPIAQVRLMKPESQLKCMESLAQNFYQSLMQDMDSGVPRGRVKQAINRILQDYKENYLYIDQIH